jgi:hypothetical protein
MRDRPSGVLRYAPHELGKTKASAAKTPNLFAENFVRIFRETATQNLDACTTRIDSSQPVID